MKRDPGWYGPLLHQALLASSEQAFWRSTGSAGSAWDQRLRASTLRCLLLPSAASSLRLSFLSGATLARRNEDSQPHNLATSPQHPAPSPQPSPPAPSHNQYTVLRALALTAGPCTFLSAGPDTCGRVGRDKHIAHPSSRTARRAPEGSRGTHLSGGLLPWVALMRLPIVKIGSDRQRWRQQGPHTSLIAEVGRQHGANTGQHSSHIAMQHNSAKLPSHTRTMVEVFLARAFRPVFFTVSLVLFGLKDTVRGFVLNRESHKALWEVERSGGIIGWCRVERGERGHTPDAPDAPGGRDDGRLPAARSAGAASARHASDADAGGSGHAAPAAGATDADARHDATGPGGDARSASSCL